MLNTNTDTANSFAYKQFLNSVGLSMTSLYQIWAMNSRHEYVVREYEFMAQNHSGITHQTLHGFAAWYLTASNAI